MDSILNDLYQFAYDNGIGVVLNRTLSPNCPSIADTETSKILVNLNQPGYESQLPFQVAHEITHVIEHHKSLHGLGFHGEHSEPRIELEANRGAIRMLLPYYVDERSLDHVSFTQFMDYFMIPSHLEKNVIEEFQALA